MFYFPGSLSLEVNLHAGAMACRIASEAGSLEAVPPVESNLGPFSPVLYIPHSERLRLPLVAWRRDDIAIVALAGLQTYFEAVAFLGGSQRPATANHVLGQVNGQVKTFANNAYVAVELSTLSTATDFKVFGHSAGGAVAHVLASLLKTANRQPTAKVATYGAPRFGSEVFDTHNGVVCEARVMNYADSYPTLIPHTNESPTFAQLSTPAGQGQINLLVQGRNGVALDVDSNLVESLAPFGLTSSPAYDFFVTRTGANLIGNNPHSIVNYEANLLRRSVALPAAPLRGPTIDTGPEVAPPRSTRGELKRTVVAAQAAQSIPYASRAPATASVVRVVRSAGWYEVTVLGETVYSTQSRLDAKGVSRALRSSYIQYWQRPWQFVPPEALAKALYGQVDLSRPPITA